MDPVKNTVENTKAAVAQWDPGVVALGKIIMGLGLVGIVVWLSPMTLTDLLMSFGIPLLIIGLLLFGIGLTGSGMLELLNSKDIGKKVKDYVEAQVQEPLQ